MLLIRTIKKKLQSLLSQNRNVLRLISINIFLEQSLTPGAKDPTLMELYYYITIIFSILILYSIQILNTSIKQSL